MKRIFNKISNKGFTLVEVIISIGFLCIACVVIIQLFIASGEVRTKTSLIETASLKALNAIEASKLSDSPKNVGRGIFNEDSTDYQKTENGYVIREYFNETWDEPISGVPPVFVVKTLINEIHRLPDTPDRFGMKSTGVIISGLYEINVTAGYIDTGREDSILAEFSTSRHYTYKGSSE